MPEYLETESSGGVGLVTMDRPPVNAVHQPMYQEIRDLFVDVDQRLPGVRAIVLTGRGENFCAGNDLTEFTTLTPQNSPVRMKLVREAFWSVYDCPVPVIAAVRGAALGTGLAIAASCDFAICGESARLGCPEVAVGVMGAAKHLSRLVPQPLVRLMYFTAEPWPARQLANYGGVVRVVADEDLLDEALTLAGRIAARSPVALRTAKASLNTIEHMDLKAGYEHEQQLTGQLSGHPDAKEALNAYVEKRAPAFSMASDGSPMPPAPGVR